MPSTDPNTTEAKPVQETPGRLSDLQPKAVSDEEGEIVKGGPKGPSWQKPLA